MKRKVLALFLIRIIKLGISIFTLSLSASFFGVSVERDVWLLALNTMIVIDLALWGPLNETFRAKFIFFKEELGETIALKKTNALLVFTNGITVLIVAFMLWKPQVIASVIAPTYQGEQLKLLLFMIRIIAPSFLFNQLTQIMISILNSYHSIYIPEISGFISSIISLVLILALAPKIGILALVCSYYIGLFLLFGLLIFQIRSKKIGLLTKIKEIRISDTKQFIYFALPFFFPYFIAQASFIIEKSIASSLVTGTVSMLDYSRKFSEILLSVLSSVITTMLLPVLSLKFAQHDDKGFVSEFKQIYQIGFLIIIGTVTVFTVCPYSIIEIIYKKGSISIGTLSEITRFAMFYSWSTVSIFIYLILGMALIASKKGKYYAFYGVSAQIIMISINLTLYKVFGVIIFPLSLFISHFIAALLMFGNLPYGKRELGLSIIKYLFILLATISFMYPLNLYVIPSDSPYLILVFNALFFISFLVFLSFFMKLDERLILVKWYIKFKSKIK